MNTSGKRVDRELPAWKATSQLIKERTPDLDRANIEEFIADGEDLRDILCDIVHENLHPRGFETGEMRHWLRFSYPVASRAWDLALASRQSQNPEPTSRS